MAAASLEQVIDGHIEAVAQQADVGAARLVTSASWIEVHMTKWLLTRSIIEILSILQYSHVTLNDRQPFQRKPLLVWRICTRSASDLSSLQG